MNERAKFRFNTSNESILWESKIKASFWDLLRYKFNYFSFLLFFVGFIFSVCFIWLGLSYGIRYEYWFLCILSSILFGVLIVSNFYTTFNFKSMYLTRKGLIVKTRFNGELFYPYGSFVMYSDAKIINTHYNVNTEEITIFSLKQSKKTFAIPKKMPPLKSYILKEPDYIIDQIDFLGAFENHEEFKKLCTQYTQLALKTMNAEEKEQFFNLCLNVPYNVFEVIFEFY